MAGVGAVLNIIMMMVANLVGFVIGTDGTRFFVSELFGTSSGLLLLINFPCALRTHPRRRCPVSGRRVLLFVCRGATHV